MKPSWVTKTDPEKYPVRFLGNIWQQKMKASFGVEKLFIDKQWGQLKTLRQHLGDLSQPLIEWVVVPVNWWHFCQEVRKGWKTMFVPYHPDIGFLLRFRGVALRVMRSKLGGSPEGADFIEKLDEKKYQETKALALVFATDNSGNLAKVEAAKTLTDIQVVLNQMLDHSTH